ncbi:hypothetical protein FQN60_013129 [Etheostoma spectabile]|uniref:Uncharacterized protein n=1 Tax=Etheostoma spectabile TaxID=54343 RepID=A0A5J5D8Q5_9PERO|nr:hypothetical protein FQN60_013129 [Etheostoma spectabile]
MQCFQNGSSRRDRDWTPEDWGKAFSQMNPLPDCLASGKKLSGEEGERYHQSCVMPTVKHPETIHVWGCFSAKEWAHSQFCLKTQQ